MRASYTIVSTRPVSHALAVRGMTWYPFMSIQSAKPNSKKHKVFHSHTFYSEMVLCRNEMFPKPVASSSNKLRIFATCSRCILTRDLRPSANACMGLHASPASPLRRPAPAAGGLGQPKPPTATRCPPVRSRDVSDTNFRPSCRRCFLPKPVGKGFLMLWGACSLAGTDGVALFVISLDAALEG